MNTKILVWMIGLLILSAFSALAMTASSTSSSVSSTPTSSTYPFAQGTLTWNGNYASLYDTASPSSSYSLTINPYQKNNLNNRLNELVVRFAEEYFKTQALKYALGQSLASSTTLALSFSNTAFLLSNFNGEVYNSNHVQMTQTTTNCDLGSICFIGRMYSSSGQLILSQSIIVFPNGNTNIIASGGIEA